MSHRHACGREAAAGQIDKPDRKKYNRHKCSRGEKYHAERTQK